MGLSLGHAFFTALINWIVHNANEWLLRFFVINTFLFLFLHGQLIPAAFVLQHAGWPGFSPHRWDSVWDCAGSPGYPTSDWEKSVQSKTKAALWTPRSVLCLIKKNTRMKWCKSYIHKYCFPLQPLNRNCCESTKMLYKPASVTTLHFSNQTNKENLR